MWLLDLSQTWPAWLVVAVLVLGYALIGADNT
jgi:hypothetical protein